MIRYKIDVISALNGIGINSGTVKKSGLFSQSFMTKLKNADASITCHNLDKLCALLGLQPGDIVEYVDDITKKSEKVVDNH